MGTVLAIMGGYYLLSGQATKALGEAAKWLKEKLPKPEDENKQK